MNTDADAVESAGVDAHELGEHCRSWAPYQAWPREPPASSLQAGLRKKPLQSPRRWGLRHTARQGVAAWVESPPQGEARWASANHTRWRARAARTREKCKREPDWPPREVSHEDPVHLRGSTEQPLGIQEG